MSSPIPTRAFILLMLMPVLACGRKDADTGSAEAAGDADTVAIAETSDTVTTASAESTPAEPTGGSSEAVTIEDIDRWEKGMAAEMKAVQETQAKLKNAKTSEDKLSIMMQMTEQNTAAAGAQAAGLDEERYKFVRAKLSDVSKWLGPPDIGGFDTTQLPESQRAEYRNQRDEYLKQTAWAVPSNVVEALKPRAAELRKKDFELALSRLPR